MAVSAVARASALLAPPAPPPGRRASRFQQRLQGRAFGGEVLTGSGQIGCDRFAGIQALLGRPMQRAGAALRAGEQAARRRGLVLMTPRGGKMADAHGEPVRIVERAEHRVVVGHAPL